MIKIDKEKCIGCGTCASVCESVFELNEDGKAQLKKDSKIDDKCVTEAIEACPVEAISQE